MNLTLPLRPAENIQQFEKNGYPLLLPMFESVDFESMMVSHRIGWWENLQESPNLIVKTMVSCRFSLKPIQWVSCIKSMFKSMLRRSQTTDSMVLWPYVPRSNVGLYVYPLKGAFNSQRLSYILIWSNMFIYHVYIIAWYCVTQSHIMYHNYIYILNMSHRKKIKRQY